MLREWRATRTRINNLNPKVISLTFIELQDAHMVSISHPPAPFQADSKQSFQNETSYLQLRLLGLRELGGEGFLGRRAGLTALLHLVARPYTAPLCKLTPAVVLPWFMACP